jgi:hypothetical protein
MYQNRRALQIGLGGPVKGHLIVDVVDGGLGGVAAHVKLKHAGTSFEGLVCHFLLLSGIEQVFSIQQ